MTKTLDGQQFIFLQETVAIKYVKCFVVMGRDVFILQHSMGN